MGEALNEVAYGQGLVVTGRFFNQTSTQFTNFDDIDENSDQLSFFPRHWLLLNSNEAEMAAERRFHALQVVFTSSSGS